MKDVKREAKGDDGNRAKYERKRNNGRAGYNCARRGENKRNNRKRKDEIEVTNK